MAATFTRLCFIWCALLVHSSTGSLHYEWAGIFDTPEDMYMWTAQKVEGAYVDPGMKLVALPATSGTHEELDSLADAGNAALTLSCTEVVSGGTITPGTICYQLKFDLDSWQTLFKIDASAANAIAFFAEHVPTEFESTAHYLKDSIGTDIEPGAELPEGEAEVAPFGSAVGAAILVNLVTLIGVVFFVPAMSRLAATYHVAFHGVISGFAAGALLSCAFFLLLFEATHLVGEGWTEEVDILWRWGTMILAGFALPAVIDNSLGLVDHQKETNDAEKKTAVPAQGQDQGQVQVDVLEQGQVDVLEGQVEVQVEGQTKQEDCTGTPQKSRIRLIGSVLLGDFFHNLCDGFFLGAAFKGCGSSFGWSVALATILHELPQELADFAVLLSPEAGVRPVLAVVANFVSGLSVLLGTIIILLAEVDNPTIGLLLAFGGGVYLHVGATDLMPKIYSPKLSRPQRVACFGAFVLGAILIGLILIGHEHCVPEGEAHHH